MYFILHYFILLLQLIIEFGYFLYLIYLSFIIIFDHLLVLYSLGVHSENSKIKSIACVDVSVNI
jgi:hypothetical protein